MYFLAEIIPEGWQIVMSSGTDNDSETGSDVLARVYADHRGVKGLECNGENVWFIPESYTETDNPQKLSYKAEGWAMRDTIRAISPGLFEVERSWHNKSGTDREVSFIFELKTGFASDFYLIPCVNYNGNHWGNGMEPKGLEHEGKPWVYSYNRVGVPSATFSENDYFAVGLFVTDQTAESLVSACSLERDTDGCMIHRFFWPDREEPLTYNAKNEYGEPYVKRHFIRNGDAFSVNFYIFAGCVDKPKTGWTKAYDVLWQIFKREKKAAFEPEKVWELGIRYATESLLRKTDNGSMFVLGYLPEGPMPAVGEEGKQWVEAPWKKYEIGWCGQNAALANALIGDYIFHENEAWFQTGIEVLDTWQKFSRLENGLFHVYLKEDYSPVDGLMDTCNLAWGAWQMMDGYRLAQKADIEKSNWLDMGLKLCDFFVKHYDEEYLFGKSWNDSGEMVERDGTIGCFLIIPLLEAYKITGKQDYLECAKKAFRGYVTRDLDNIQCTAGALDTYCIDKETCWPLLKTGLDLFEITGEAYYLEKSKLAGYYLLSWMFLYDAIYPEGSDFHRYKYSTYGGTSVSTTHQLLDPWGALIATDWIRLSELSGDEKWYEIAMATWENSLLCLSDGSLKIHGMIRPAGSQNETYQNCNWKTRQCRTTTGTINDWLVAWPGAFRLISLMREKNWDVFR